MRDLSTIPGLSIVRLVTLPAEVEGLRAEAAGEGFRFMDRLVAHWRSGENRFGQSGEVLLGGFRDAAFLAVGGLNQEPYADEDGIGRLRHVYVSRSARRAGLGSAIVSSLMARADGTFRSVRLRTDTRAAAAFYESLGFEAVPYGTATHLKRL